MHMTVKAENCKITISVPAEWNGTELEVDIKPASPAESILQSLDRITGGKRIDTTDWKFDRDALHDRKAFR